MIARRGLLLGAAAATASSAAFAQSADFMGEWNGALDLGATRLRLKLVLSAGPSAIIYSIDQGNAAIPGADVRIDGDRISLRFPSVNASYEGQLRDGGIEGRFTQGQAIPLNFVRGEVAPPAPIGPLTQDGIDALRREAEVMAIGAAAANRDGRTLALVTGTRALNAPPITNDDKWHLGSITKSMTATLVARCVEAGLVSWDDTLWSVLGAAAPDMRADYRDCSFRHLTSHRAGLQANLEMADFLNFPRQNPDPREDRVRYARLALAQAPNGPKEQSFLYSNSGFVLAGAMLEAKLGAPWESIVRERLFAPLGMDGAGFGAPGTAGANDQPIGHTPIIAGGPLVGFPPGAAINDNPAVLGPAGRVHAPFADVLKFLTAHRDRSDLLRRESWERLHAPPFGGEYALGLVKRGDALWHNGSNTLWYAEVLIDASRGLVAAAATNDGRMMLAAPLIGRALTGAAQAVA